MTELLFRDDAYTRSCEATVTAIDGQGFQLDRTVFYPTGGGQPGDTGRLTRSDGSASTIVNTVKGDSPEDIVHLLEDGATVPAVGETVQVEIDWDRRHRLMRMHTGMHLLSAILPYPVTGGSVGDGKGRLDFDIPEATLDKDAITAELNRLISEDHPVAPRWVTDDELTANPDLVKTMAVKPPMGLGKVRLIDIDGLDLQACGGTHVARTGEIGAMRVRKIEKKGRQNRRVSLEFVD